MSAHTPGPWRTMGADPTRVSGTVGGYPTTIAVVNRERDVALISAAPELYALLHNLVYNETQRTGGVSLGSISRAARQLLDRLGDA
jgi:hypothetical protein